MNSMIGKSTGIALLMAAALLAALFAMGVFSASGVGAEVRDADATATPAYAGPSFESYDNYQSEGHKRHYDGQLPT